MKIKKTVLILGYECNNNCIFCCHSDRRGAIKGRNAAEIKKSIFEARKNGSSYLELIGGEPTIRKDIPELVSFAKKVGFETIMFATNGRMFSNADFTRRIIVAGVNKVVFSIHGHNEELHDSLTRSPGSFTQLLMGIANLKQIGFKNIESNTTIVRQNYDYLLKIGNMLISLGIKNSEFIFVDPTNGISEKTFFDIVPTYPEISFQINHLLDLTKENSVNWRVRYYPLCFIKKEHHDKVSEIHENAIFLTSHIAPDFINHSVQEGRKIFGMTKIEKCKGCEYDSICEGYWKKYLETYFDVDASDISSIKSRIGMLKKEDPFYSDILQYLLGLKPVLRLDAGDRSRDEERLRWCEGDYIIRSGKYLFISKDRAKAIISKNLTLAKGGKIKSEKVNRLFGNPYGYPNYCSENFDNLDFSSEKIKHDFRKKKACFDEGRGYIIHYPCSTDCEDTDMMKRKVLSRLDILGLIDPETQKSREEYPREHQYA